MRVIHSGSCNIHAGGPALSTWLTIKGLRKHGVEAELITRPLPPENIIETELKPYFSKNPKLGPLAYVPGFSASLDKIGKADIYHVQGVWMLHGTQMAHYARKHSIPYVVTLRGMLYPQALSTNANVKRYSMALYQADTLRNAAAIQATCVEEMEYYRQLGFKNPVAVIPNPIETDEIIEQPLSIKTKFRIGYIGRVHPRKHIERLIHSMTDLQGSLPNDAELLIIGGGDTLYEDFLHREVKRLNLSNVRFTGFLSGEEKNQAINSLSLLVVPSDFENFGNIVTEALVRGVPVVASKGMPWAELPEYDCGWWIDNDQPTINETILKAYRMGPDQLMKMGRNGRELILRNYSVEALGKKMQSLYNWILGDAEKPDFVYL